MSYVSSTSFVGWRQIIEFAVYLEMFYAQGGTLCIDFCTDNMYHLIDIENPQKFDVSSYLISSVSINT